MSQPILIKMLPPLRRQRRRRRIANALLLIGFAALATLAYLGWPS